MATLWLFGATVGDSVPRLYAPKEKIPHLHAGLGLRTNQERMREGCWVLVCVRDGKTQSRLKSKQFNSIEG